MESLKSLLSRIPAMEWDETELTLDGLRKLGDLLETPGYEEQVNQCYRALRDRRYEINAIVRRVSRGLENRE
jgi:hypothetical protein